jgi:hydrogenase nickel incorporation protein HypB
VCTTCGCSDHERPTLTDLETGQRRAIGTRQHHGHHHDHGHEHRHDDHDHAHAHARHHGTTVTLEQRVLAKNDRQAERNRGWLEAKEILALNLMSSPGAGKTTLLERTISTFGRDTPISVIEGDQDTAVDAERIRRAGCRVVQVNTGTGCHLDAEMLAAALNQLSPPSNSVVMIENVGNLVCPALFDLGEQAKVVILSVTEGDDKPLKYPHMFRAADLLILNKIDLLPHVDFDVGLCMTHARRINPRIECLQLSATTGQGIDAWCDWLRQRVKPDALAGPALAW